MARSSIQGAAETHTGNVRDHNEDAHLIDVPGGIFAVFDGMGGNASGEVASALAAATIADRWGSEATQRAIDTWLRLGTRAARRALIDVVKAGVKAAHQTLVAAAQADRAKQGMGTTLVGALAIGSEVTIAYCGDSRAYLVRDGQATQVTEDHTLLQRLISAGIDVDTANDGSRWNNVLTNAVGLDQKFQVAVCFVPIADNDRLLLCSDGVTQYAQLAEIAEIVSSATDPAAAAKRLVDIALARGGSDNATALVMRVDDAGTPRRSVSSLQRERNAIAACPLWGTKISPQEQFRALRMALSRAFTAGVALPAHDRDDRLAWIILDGQVEQNGQVCGPGSLLYPEALLAGQVLPTDDALWIARYELCALAVSERDFSEICDEDSDLGQKLQAALAALVAEQPTRRLDPQPVAKPAAGGGGARGTDPRIHARGSKPPIDQRGFGHTSSSESPLVLALTALAEQRSEPEISIEPWLDHALADTANTSDNAGSAPLRGLPRGAGVRGDTVEGVRRLIDREPSQPIEIPRDRRSPKDHG